MVNIIDVYSMWSILSCCSYAEKRHNDVYVVGINIHSDYYNLYDVKKGVNIHELWDYVKTNMKDECEFFVKEFNVSITYINFNCAKPCVSNIIFLSIQRGMSTWTLEHSLLL